jgi:hypothetical protein
MLDMQCVALSERKNLSAHDTPVFSQSSGIHVPSYLSAYADGEGCFCISLCKSLHSSLGWEVRPSFSVSQNSDRAEVLYLYKSYFGCGGIRPDRSDKTLKYEVRSLKDLVNIIIPHFLEFPMLSSKQDTFLSFRKVCELLSNIEILDKETIAKILLLSEGMNPSGKRKYILSENKDIVSINRNIE